MVPVDGKHNHNVSSCLPNVVISGDNMNDDNNGDVEIHLLLQG